jgi:hypothetical protein
MTHMNGRRSGVVHVLAAVMAVVLVGGCVSPRGKAVYEKPGVAQAQKQADEAECTKAGLDVAEGPRGSAFLAVDRDAVDRCMQARGYRITVPR